MYIFIFNRYGWLVFLLLYFFFDLFNDGFLRFFERLGLVLEELLVLFIVLFFFKLFINNFLVCIFLVFYGLFVFIIGILLFFIL